MSRNDYTIYQLRDAVKNKEIDLVKKIILNNKNLVNQFDDVLFSSV